MADEIKSELETNDVEGKESSATDASLNTAEQIGQDDKGGENTRIPYERFKQKVDEVNALKERLAEIEREQEEAEREELEEKEEYKTLYEEALQTITQMKDQEINSRKETLLTQAGYSEEQTAMLSKLVEGETVDEIKTSIEVIKETFPTEPEYVDPSVGNNRGGLPEAKDGEDFGRSTFERLVKSGRIRGFKK